MELIDTHCHLTFPPLMDDLNAVLGRAKARGVSRIVVPAYDHLSWEQVSRVSEIDGVYPAFGLHPWVADERLDIEALRRRLIRENAVAVGEIGLDFKIGVPREKQADVFLRQMACACDLDLPVLLHVRGAFEEMLEILCRMNPRPSGVIHAFSRGPELAKRFLDLGFHIAFGGAVTRPNAKQARHAAATVPEDRLLLETDAPSIGLADVKPKAVEPAHVADIAACLASLRGETVEHIAARTTENAKKLFRFVQSSKE